jgi:hypothetical protein
MPQVALFGKAIHQNLLHIVMNQDLYGAVIKQRHLTLAWDRHQIQISPYPPRSLAIYPKRHWQQHPTDNMLK